MAGARREACIRVNSETGNVYVVDQGNARVQEFDATGTTALGEFHGAAAAAPIPLRVDTCQVGPPSSIVREPAHTATARTSRAA